MARNASTRSGFAAAHVGRALDGLLARLRARRAPWLVGLSGLQGSGKSTLARQIAAAAARRGIAALCLSLDDFYLSRRERLRLARTVHPLLATRGAPGSHDLDLLRRTLADLRHACALRPARIPRFDKGRDTRLPPSRWRRIIAPPRLVILEGWCVGVMPQGASALRRPLNALERERDADGRWRRYVNSHLGGEYAALWRRLDALVLLEAPSFAAACRWREQAERALRTRDAVHAMSPADLGGFMRHYERLSRHALATLPARADLRLRLDMRHAVRGMTAGSTAR